MDGKELNDLFGIDDIDDESQDEVVDQDGEVTDEGADEPLDNELNQEADAGGAANRQQTPEINHQFAEARKVAEQEARNAKNEVRILQEALRGFGYEGTPQEIADAIEASRTQRSIEEIEEERLMREQEISDQIANHPDVVRAREITQALINQRNEEMFARELRNIQRINPEVKSLVDLRNLGADQNYFDFLVSQKGMHIDQAYKEIMRGKSPQEPVQRKDTRESIGTFNGSDGAPVADIPRDEELLCMEMNPGISKEEIRKFYNKYRKGEA